MNVQTRQGCELPQECCHKSCQSREPEVSVFEREWPPLEARQSEDLCLRHRMSLAEPDEDFRCFVLDWQLGAAMETALPTGVERCSGSTQHALGRIGFKAVSADRCNPYSPCWGHLLVRLTIPAGLTHNSIVASCCVSSLLQPHHPCNVGIAVTETKALPVM